VLAAPGGIGFTWPHESHLYFKRPKSTQLLLGPVSGRGPARFWQM
jgi:hypothetical protein